MIDAWYSRPVLFVADINRSVSFYIEKLGFKQRWRYDDDVAQVERHGCELILSSQRPDKAGAGLIFISLDPAVLDALRLDLETRGIAVKDGEWGYRVMIVADPDGNELYFPYPKA